MGKAFKSKEKMAQMEIVNSIELMTKIRSILED